ncbi:MAG: type II secretion system protein GspL, partial [Myxococcota bacterium]
MAKRILGLDIGAHAIKAVELRQTLRSLEVGQLRALPLEGAGSSFADELREFLRVYELPTDFVVCALPGDRVSSRRLSFPFGDRRRIAQAVPFEVEGAVPFDLDDFFIDWEPVRRHRGGADVMATLAPRAEVGALLTTLAEAGIEPRIVEAEGLVLANLCGLFELTGTRLLVDLGHRKTTLCLVAEGRPVAARTIPMAGLALTEAIAKDRAVGREEAERLKHETGVFPPGEDPADTKDHAVLDRLARELVRTVGSLESALAETAAGRLEEVTLLGGTARLHRLGDYLRQRTGLPVALLQPPPEPHRAALLSGGDPLLFAPAVALALRGTSLARTQMNFRQDEFARRLDLSRFGPDLRWTAIGLAVVIGLALASVGLDVWMGHRQARQLEAHTASLYQEAFPGSGVPDNVLGAMREAVRSANSRADLLGVYAGNLSALDLLTEISARV